MQFVVVFRNYEFEVFIITNWTDRIITNSQVSFSVIIYCQK